MKTVLVCDDEFDLTATLKAILEGDGYRAETCGDGKQALDCLKRTRPDLVYTVEVSSNMQTWTAGHAYGTDITNGSGLPTQEMERTSLGSAGERIRVRDVGGVGQRFIRVKITTL